MPVPIINTFWLRQPCFWPGTGQIYDVYSAARLNAPRINLDISGHANEVAGPGWNFGKISMETYRKTTKVKAMISSEDFGV